jgi:hypothetical protein
LSDQAGKKPYLASHRNFTEEMLHDMTRMSRNHPLFREVLGLGNRIIIPNLNMDGAYNMTVFEKAGFSSLVAVPITTYKVIGILGVADKKKKKFGNDIAQLLAIVATLVGVSVTKNSIAQEVLPGKTGPAVEPGPDTNAEEPGPTINAVEPEPATNIDSSQNSDIGEMPVEETFSPTSNITEEKMDIFSRHVRKMDRFRERHN